MMGWGGLETLRISGYTDRGRMMSVRLCSKGWVNLHPISVSAANGVVLDGLGPADADEEGIGRDLRKYYCPN